MMRQEMEPSCRMHAIIQMREDTVVNVIPDYAKVSCAVRVGFLFITMLSWQFLGADAGASREAKGAAGERSRCSGSSNGL